MAMKVGFVYTIILLAVFASLSQASLPIANMGNAGDGVFKVTDSLKVVVKGRVNQDVTNDIAILLYGDELVYTISATNASDTSTRIIIVDTIPSGLEVYTDRISDGGEFNLVSKVITWCIDVPTKKVGYVSFSATKGIDSDGLIENRAYVINDGKKRPTNPVCHRGGGARLRFAAGSNGYLSNGVSQTVDYCRYPYTGVLAHPERGYMFCGWGVPTYSTLTGGVFPGLESLADYLSVRILGDVVYTANFKPVDYCISYNLNGAVAQVPENPVSYTIMSGAYKLKNPTGQSEVFAGWTGSNGATPQEEVVIPAGSYGDLTYTAHWGRKFYTIRYDYAGGRGSEVANFWSYDVDDTPFEIANPPVRPGYDFAGWTGTNGNIPEKGVSVVKGTTGELFYKANWDLATYRILYDYNGGLPPVSLNRSVYTVEDAAFMIDYMPTRPGYTFVGWVGSNGVIPELRVYVAKGTTGELRYKAKWGFRFESDTIYTCSMPVVLESGHDGLGYEWILPDGSSSMGEDIEAGCSGRYILRTNYGSLIVSDTVFVLAPFERERAIRAVSSKVVKAGVAQQFTVRLNGGIAVTGCRWQVPGGDVVRDAGDTITVLYESAGKKTVSVTITSLVNGAVCEQTVSERFNVYPKRRSIFVNRYVGGGYEDGSSWSDAYRFLQDALAEATPGDYIWVAGAEYQPDTTFSFVLMEDSVVIYGGFKGDEERLSERNWAANATVLKGNGNAVILNSDIKGSSRWDGFIIEGGESVTGGGVQNYKSSVVIANCVIRSNLAEKGGGIYTNLSEVVLSNVEVSGNKAGNGGGLFNCSSTVDLTNLTVSGNLAENGGGLYNKESDLVIRNSIVWGNKTDKSLLHIENSNSFSSYTYSIVEGCKGSGGNWNCLLGTDAGHNYDYSPLYKTSGFDKAGRMQTGNYELSGSSRAIDRGNNTYAYNALGFDDMDLCSLKGYGVFSLIYDLNGNDRFLNDRVDLGAYEYYVPGHETVIERVVTLPSVRGITTDPIGGDHKVRSQDDFTFTIVANPGYTLDNLTVKTGVPDRDVEGLKLVENEDGSVTVTVLRVTEPLIITINGVSPVSNAAISDEKVWVYDRCLYINTDSSCDLSIYNMLGLLHLRQTVSAGKTVIALSPGFYYVRLDARVYKVRV